MLLSSRSHHVPFQCAAIERFSIQGARHVSTGCCMTWRRRRGRRGGTRVGEAEVWVREVWLLVCIATRRRRAGMGGGLPRPLVPDTRRLACPTLSAHSSCRVIISSHSCSLSSGWSLRARGVAQTADGQGMYQTRYSAWELSLAHRRGKARISSSQQARPAGQGRRRACERIRAAKQR